MSVRAQKVIVFATWCDRYVGTAGLVDNSNSAAKQMRYVLRPKSASCVCTSWISCLHHLKHIHGYCCSLCTLQEPPWVRQDSESTGADKPGVSNICHFIAKTSLHVLTIAVYASCRDQQRLSESQSSGCKRTANCNHHRVCLCYVWGENITVPVTEKAGCCPESYAGSSTDKTVLTQVLYLLGVSVLGNSRGATLQPPPPEAFGL